MSFRETVHRWFVEYNPLYFASAGCVFAGILLVSQGMPADHFASKAGVVAVTGLYELLLIAGAWLLLRAGQGRPAALLGILAFLFSIDVAFNGERLFSHARTMSLEPGMRARVALPASVVFAALAPVKLVLLAKVFRLRGVRPFLALAGSVVFLLPLLPYIVEGAPVAGAARASAHVLVTWLGAPLLGWALVRGAWRTEEGDGDRVRRIARVVPFLLFASFISHVSIWSTYADLGLTPAHAAPYVLLIFFIGAARLRGFRAELATWVGIVIAVWAAWWGPDPAEVWSAGAAGLLAGGGALALAWRCRHNLLLPGIGAAFGGAFLLAAEADFPGPVWLVPLSFTLLAGAVAMSDLRCLLASATAAGAALIDIDRAAALIPHATVLAALGLAAAGWLIFPRWRAWLPAASVALALVAGSLLVWRHPASSAAWFAATSAVAFGVGFHYAMPAYRAVGVGGGLALVALTQAAWSPHTPMSWGLLLLVLGFVFLIVGVVVNLRVAPRVTSP